MKKLASAMTIVVAISPSFVKAVDFAFQPRLEAGAMFYEFEQDDFSRITATGNAIDGLPQSTLKTESQNGVKFKDVMPFIGGGGTLFVDKLFVDVSAQYADNGSDSSGQTLSNNEQKRFPNAGDLGLPTDGRLYNFNDFQSASNSADFDRTEWAVSVGYAFTNHFAVYAGYKSAKTDFKVGRSGILRQDVCGDFGAAAPDESCLTNDIGTFTDNTKLEFEQDGPFVGGTFGWDFSQGYLNGTLAGNFAIAFLDGEVKETNKDGFFTPAPDFGDPRPLEDLSQKKDGDTTGLSLGVLWRGLTPIDALSYLIGIDGYQYDFSGGTKGDFKETVVRFKAGMAYLF
jgi:hypothetical protein